VEEPPPSRGLGSKLRGGFVSGSLLLMRVAGRAIIVC
jgi:hypothetical protein